MHWEAAELPVKSSNALTRVQSSKVFTQISQSSLIFLLKWKSLRTIDLCLPWNLCELNRKQMKMTI